MSRSFPPLMFTERRRNIILMGVALAIALAGAVTLLLLGRQDQLTTTVPIVVILMLWGMILAGNILYRRRIAPILRLEDERLRYIGGPLFAPRLHDIALANIAAIERSNASTIRLRLQEGKPRRRSIPVGLLSRQDRQRFEAALRERLAQPAR